MDRDEVVRLAIQLVSAQLQHSAVPGGDVLAHLEVTVDRIQALAAASGDAAGTALGPAPDDPELVDVLEAEGRSHWSEHPPLMNPLAADGVSRQERWDGTVHHDRIECLLCPQGNRTRLLKPHLANRHGLTPDAYRARFDLGADYPMAPAEYVEGKRQKARDQGFGADVRPMRERQADRTGTAA